MIPLTSVPHRSGSCPSWLLVNCALPDRFSRHRILGRHRRSRHRGCRRAQKQDAAATTWCVGLAAENTAWVRVKARHALVADDLAALVDTPVGGVMLAMVERGPCHRDCETTTQRADRGVVETARGLERIAEIAATKGTFRLAFGIGDFRRDNRLWRRPVDPGLCSGPLHHRRQGGQPAQCDRWPNHRLQRVEAHRGTASPSNSDDGQDLPSRPDNARWSTGDVAVAGRNILG